MGSISLWIKWVGAVLFFILAGVTRSVLLRRINSQKGNAPSRSQARRPRTRFPWFRT